MYGLDTMADWETGYLLQGLAMQNIGRRDLWSNAGFSKQRALR
jgi:hypothetical protein